MYTLFLVSPESISENQISLTGPQARHAISVLRVQVGDFIRLADGKGNWVDGPIIEVRKDALTVEARIRGADPIAKTHITVAQAILKGENQRAALDQLVQAGVESILPWQAMRSVATIDKSDKWHEVLLNSARQSRRARVPELLPKSDLRGLIAACAKNITEYDCVIALHESATSSLSADVTIANSKKILVIVGPEGGLSDQEIIELEQAGIVTRKLGSAVLRADLAGAVALGAIHALTKEW